MADEPKITVRGAVELATRFGVTVEEAEDRILSAQAQFEKGFSQIEALLAKSPAELDALECRLRALGSQP